MNCQHATERDTRNIPATTWLKCKLSGDDCPCEGVQGGEGCCDKEGTLSASDLKQRRGCNG